MSLAPHSLQHVYFVSGGSEAVEAALKMARQYYVERGMMSKTEFIARRQSYHGNTLGALAVGGNEWRREPLGPYFPLLIILHRVTPIAINWCRKPKANTVSALLMNLKQKYSNLVRKM